MRLGRKVLGHIVPVVAASRVILYDLILVSYHELIASPTPDNVVAVRVVDHAGAGLGVQALAASQRRADLVALVVGGKAGLLDVIRERVVHDEARNVLLVVARPAHDNDVSDLFDAFDGYRRPDFPLYGFRGSVCLCPRLSVQGRSEDRLGVFLREMQRKNDPPLLKGALCSNLYRGQLGKP